MKRFAALAVTALLLSMYACAAEDNAQTTEDAPASAPEARTETPPAAESREKAMARARAEAAANDNLTAAAPRQPAPEPEPASTDAPATNPAARNINDPDLVARGDQAFKAGRDYIVLTPAQRTSSPPEKIEITEVFMYQCPHCFSFDPFMDSLIKEQPADVNVVRLPAIFNPIAELHAKAFFAARATGVWEQLHTPFFSEIHTNRNLMRTEDELLDFVAKQGIDRDSFANAMRSFEVDSKVRDAKDLNRRYRIDSVPTMVVNGKYVTSASLVGSTSKLKSVLDYLVSKESTSR